MDFATNSIRIEAVTPEKAAEYLKCNYAHQRPLRKMHVAYLANEMRNGRFISTAEVHLMYRNGEALLVNGQHTCAAIIEYGKPVSVTLRKTVASEPGQIAMVYAFGHDSGLKRTFTDAIGSYNLPEQTGLVRKDIESLSASIKFMKSGFSANTQSGGVLRIAPADLIEDMYGWVDEAKRVTSVVNGKDNRIYRAVRKRAIMSVALVTMRYQPEKAKDFWRGIVDFDAIARNDPRHHARTVIENSIHRFSGGNNGGNDAKLSRQVARCWNGYFREETMSQVKVLDDTAPIVLLGTPFNGKQPGDFLPTKGYKQAA